MSRSGTTPVKPDLDSVTALMLEAYNDISRGRIYVGMAGVPAPLSLADVQRYANATGTALDIEELEAVVMALDEECREDWHTANSDKESKPARPAPRR